MSAGPMRNSPSRSTVIAAIGVASSLLRHAVEEADGRAQAEAEPDRQGDDDGKPETEVQKPEHRASGHDREDFSTAERRVLCGT